MGRNIDSSRSSSPVVLGMHAGALAIFALVIAGGAGSVAQPLLAIGFMIVAASFMVARSGHAAPPRRPRGLTQRIEPVERVDLGARVAA